MRTLLNGIINYVLVYSGLAVDRPAGTYSSRLIPTGPPSGVVLPRGRYNFIADKDDIRQVRWSDRAVRLSLCYTVKPNVVDRYVNNNTVY